jgi:hypothetical protein
MASKEVTITYVYLSPETIKALGIAKQIDCCGNHNVRCDNIEAAKAHLQNFCAALNRAFENPQLITSITKEMERDTVATNSHTTYIHSQLNNTGESK